MLFRTSFLLPHLSYNVEFEFSWFHNTEQSLEISILKIEILLEFPKKTNIKIIGFKLMHFGFAIVSSDIELGNTDLLDTHLDLLDTDIHNKPFTSLQNILKTSSRHVLKTSSGCLQQNNFLLSKTSWRFLVRGLEYVLENEKLLQWILVEDVFNTCLQDVFKMDRKPWR